MPYIKKPEWAISENEVTPQGVYLDRRAFMVGAGSAGLAVALPSKSDAASPLATLPSMDYADGESLTKDSYAKGYNNFYEFGTDKSDPAKYAQPLNTFPWTIEVSGECENTVVFDVEKLVSYAGIEERVYRLRCVEAWSMVIPWMGVSLVAVIKALAPTSRAKYVAFETLADERQMPGLRSRVLNWPYREGLRMDEAMNALSFLATGIYGDTLPNQNGAPLRLVVPWKYGFKSIKSIVKIHFQETEPACTWAVTNPREYGFYSNVNPEVDHPRWSQASERRIGEFRRRDTLMFNGYGDQVAQIYAGMNLKKNF